MKLEIIMVLLFVFKVSLKYESPYKIFYESSDKIITRLLYYF